MSKKTTDGLICTKCLTEYSRGVIKITDRCRRCFHDGCLSEICIAPEWLRKWDSTKPNGGLI